MKCSNDDESYVDRSKSTRQGYLYFGYKGFIAYEMLNDAKVYDDANLLAMEAEYTYNLNGNVSCVGLDLIYTKVGKLMRLNAHTNFICLNSWGHSEYARALVEVSAEVPLVDSVDLDIPLEDGNGIHYGQIRDFIADHAVVVVCYQESVGSFKDMHIEIRLHFRRDCYEKRTDRSIKIHTDHNVADLLTKGFDVTRFNFLVVSIGLLNL
ncbi:hypothetical protein Tco_1408882 [Tanacetum coccineum]